jgi:hypothetical protein
MDVPRLSRFYQFSSGTDAIVALPAHLQTIHAAFHANLLATPKTTIKMSKLSLRCDIRNIIFDSLVPAQLRKDS